MRKLGGFTYTFAEITDVKNSEPGFPCGKLRFQKTIYISLREKSSSGTGNLGLFSKKNEKRTLITFPTGYIEHRRTETHIRTPPDISARRPSITPQHGTPATGRPEDSSRQAPGRKSAVVQSMISRHFRHFPLVFLLGA